MLEEELFKRCTPDFSKFKTYGFQKKGNNYFIQKNVLNDSFLIQVDISENGKVHVTVIDLDMDEEYTAFRIENHVGEFAGQVREEVISFLEDIRDHTFQQQYFVSPQANRLAEKINDKYGDRPSFEWEDTPYTGVFKNKDSKKWYGIIMNADYKSVHDGEGNVDILNMKLDPEEILSLCQRKGFYPAYHMNKKYWISVTLDERVSDDEIMTLLEESYEYSGGFVSHEWLIPANPKYYDVVGAFEKNKILQWKQSSNVQVGDIIYLYVASPISAILFQCKVLKTNIPYSFQNEDLSMKKVMEIECLKKYKPDQFPFSFLKKYGVNAVRGPRKLPKKLSEVINNQK